MALGPRYQRADVHPRLGPKRPAGPVAQNTGFAPLSAALTAQGYKARASRYYRCRELKKHGIGTGLVRIFAARILTTSFNLHSHPPPFAHDYRRSQGN